jgi:hypothetical protein
MIKPKTKIKVVTRYTVARHPQAAELRQWLLRTIRTNGTNSQTRAASSSS